MRRVNTDTAEKIRYDAGKKISGIKRHIAKDKGFLSNVSTVLVDGGYSGKKFADKMQDILEATVEVAKRNE